MDETIQRVMPEQLRPVFEDIRGQVMLLHMKWRLYLDFFESDASLAVINELGPGAFKLIEHSLRTDLIITLCRLTDPVGSGQRQNLTLDRLLADMRPLCPPAVYDCAENLVRQLCRQLEPVRDLRNRAVGHNDLRTALATHPEPLPQLTRAHFARSADLLAALLNEIDLHFTEGETAFAHPVQVGSGADVIHHLRRASRAYDEEDAALRAQIRNLESPRPSVQ